MNSSSWRADYRRGPILLLARSLNIGGSERQLVQLAMGLTDRGYDIAVGLFYRGGALEQELAGRHIRILDLGKRHRWDVAGFMVRFVRTLRLERPSLVYSFLGTANTVAALARAFAPPFRLIWSVRASNMKLANYGWASRLGYRLECALSRVPDLTISNSRAGLEHAVAHGFPRRRLVVVPNGIDATRFRPDRELRRKMRAMWGLGEETHLIGVLARLDPMKDHATFLRAAARVIAVRPSTRFVCIGEGEADYVEQLRKLASSLGLEDRLIWADAEADPVGALNAFDVFCSSSSEGEGFSNAVAEAMACALPCVVTDVGDSAFIVGDAGWVVPPKDPESLSRALLTALDRGATGIGSRARIRIVESFSPDRMVEETIAYF